MATHTHKNTDTALLSVRIRTGSKRKSKQLARLSEARKTDYLFHPHKGNIVKKTTPGYVGSSESSFLVVVCFCLVCLFVFWPGGIEMLSRLRFCQATFNISGS